MSDTRAAQVEEYGWTAVSCDPKQRVNTKSSAPQLVKDVPFPSTAVAKATLEYAEAELPSPTFNHSMRVFYYGMTASFCCP